MLKLIGGNVGSKLNEKVAIVTMPQWFVVCVRNELFFGWEKQNYASNSCNSFHSCSAIALKVFFLAVKKFDEKIKV